MASENKVAELTRMVHSLTKEATNSEHRSTMGDLFDPLKHFPLA